MAITYEYEVKGIILSVVAYGKHDDLESVKQYGRALLQLAIKHKCSKVL